MLKRASHQYLRVGMTNVRSSKTRTNSSNKERTRHFEEPKDDASIILVLFGMFELSRLIHSMVCSCSRENLLAALFSVLLAINVHINSEFMYPKKNELLIEKLVYILAGSHSHTQ